MRSPNISRAGADQLVNTLPFSQASARAGAIQTASKPPDHSPPLSDSPHGLEEHGNDDAEGLGRASTGPTHSVFTNPQKYYICFLAAWGTFFSPLSANIYFPTLTTLAKDLKVSDELINLTLTSYMIFQGLAPTVFGDLADMVGRRPAYIVGFIIYTAANIGLALQNNYAALFILRCLQSTGSSGTVALGNGVVADIATSGERGTYIGYVQFGGMTAPAIAPILGGILSKFLGWRSIFWFLTIMSVVYLIIFLISFPETGRNVVGNGSVPPQGWNMSVINYLHNRAISRNKKAGHSAAQEETKRAQQELASKRKLKWPNPLKTVHIVMEKDVGMLLVFNGIVYTAFYAVISSIPYLFAQIYGFNDLQIGLSFIPFGAGCSMASLFFGRLMDFNYRRVAKKSGLRVDLKRGDDMRAFPLEKARIQIIWPAVLVGVVVILCYGWVMEREAHFAAPLVLFFLVGLSLTGAANVMITMCVDLYPSSPSTATAANNLVRCLLGAGGTAVIIQMIKAMGRGWCFTFVAAVVFLTSPMLWVITKWGPKWREERRTRAIKQQEEKEEKEATQWKCPEDTFSVPEKLQHADRKLRDMTNITPILAELLDQRNVHLRTDTGAHPAASIKDEFLKEAYSINTHTRSFAHYLRSIRRSYLSIAPTTPFRRSGLASARSSSAAAGAATTTDDLTNAQRDQIDAESKTILRSLHAKIAQLEEAEGLRQDTAVRVLLNRRAKRIGFGGRLGRWAAGEAGGGERRVGGGLSDLDEAERAEKARSDTTKAWREGVVWCLKKRLEAAGELQRGMMERRIEREVERGKSMLYKAKGTGLDTGVGRQEWVREGGAAGEAAMRDEEEKKGVEAELSAEQLQLFKEENDSMLKHYEDTLDQVRTAELSMLEISELQTTLVANLETQSANIVQMVEDAVNTTENVTGGNRELKRATERENIEKAYRMLAGNKEAVYSTENGVGHIGGTKL